MGDLSKDFSTRELCCPCARCTRNGVVPKKHLIDLLQAVRDDLGHPIRVTSGIRCRDHNEAVDGAPLSRHLPEFGDAVDIACGDSYLRRRLVEALFRHGATAVKCYPKHVHADCRPGSGMFIV